MQKQRRPSSMSGMGLGSRGDKNNHRRTSTASQSTDAELDQTAISSVAEYQLVFQQLKQEYPASASGALHQLTMARLAEIKANRELEEQRERNKQEEEERPLNVLATKLVGMIMPGDTVGRRRPTVGSDSTSSLWNRREREDFNSSSDSILGANSRPSMLLRMSAPSDHQPPHSRRLSLFPRQDAMPPNDPDLVNIARRTSNEPVPEIDELFTNSLEDKNMIGARRRRRSDISLLSDLSGLFDDENIDATTDHNDDEENVDLLRNDTDDNSKPTTSSSENRRDINSDDQIIVTKLIGLDLSKNLPKRNEEKATHCTTTMSVASDVTSSDCCSTASSNGMIVGFSDQRTNDDDNDLIVGFVNRRRCESPY